MELTNEFIASLLKPQIEFRSEKKFLETISDNYLNREWIIIGWVSDKTLDKWGVEHRKGTYWEDGGPYWVFCKGNNYWYVETSLKR